MLSAHPYEEVAYDLYPLEMKGKEWGYGKIGSLPAPISFGEFAKKVKEAYQLSGLRIVGDPATLVRRVALLGGSGARYYLDAKRQGADVYITGDIDFHTAQDALAAGICLIDPGHHVEHLVVEKVCEVLEQKLGKEIPIFPSETDTNPFQFL
jgi:putative NIF3 family GTP cyclohydrolase 1 type 2